MISLFVLVREYSGTRTLAHLFPTVLLLVSLFSYPPVLFAQESVGEDPVRSFPSLIQIVADGSVDHLSAELKKNPKSVNVRTKAGATPLLVAILVGNAEARELLLNAGADPTLGDAEKRTPLIMAAFRGDNDAIRSLIRFEAVRRSINAQMAPVGATALHLSMANNNGEGVRLLIGAGASPNIVDAAGDTPRWFCENELIGACHFLPR